MTGPAERDSRLAIHLHYTASRPTMVQPDELLQNQKTIFIVDDDPAMRSYVSALLAGIYHILISGSGDEALLQARAYKGEIHLLLSDFQMPGMSGVELATAMTAERPQLKVLLMSGFPEGMLILNEGWHFLAKPFIASQLRALVAGLAYPDKASKYVD
jgi:DNA-binding NtrC family response regulator